MNFQVLYSVLQGIFSLYGIFIMVAGVSIGILGGATPGISTTMTMAIVAPMTYTMEPLWAITMLASLAVGGVYGGSISATILNLPGTPASAATALEAYPLAKSGEAERALSFNVISSTFGNSIGVVLLIVFIPVIVAFALLFGPWEMFLFAFFGITICANLSRANFIKGLMASLIGLFISCIGMDPLLGTTRFAFGSTYLSAGVSIIPAMIGLFGLSEVFLNLSVLRGEVIPIKRYRVFEFKFWFQYKWLALKCSILGFLIGVIPGVGPDIASWVGYDYARSSSKEKEKFGKGSYEGIVGSESANNACVPGAYAPLLTLGVPGSAGGAIVMGILMIHGIRPGPMFLATNPEWLYQIAIALFLAGILLLFIGSVLSKIIVKILVVPVNVIMIGVVLLCVIGAFGLNFRIQDVYLMFFFGILGLLMKKFEFPIAPMVLGIILGGTLSEANFRRALMLADGSIIPFFTRPVSLILVIVIVFLLTKDIVINKIKSYKLS